MDTAITLKFGPGEYTFFLPMARICEVERLCGDKSIGLMYEELSLSIGIERDSGAHLFASSGPFRLRDIYEIIRCAAIGGGLSPLEAKTLVDEYVDGRPISETLPVAWAILRATIEGVSLKKKASPEGRESGDTKSSAEASSSSIAAS